MSQSVDALNRAAAHVARARSAAETAGASGAPADSIQRAIDYLDHAGRQLSDAPQGCPNEYKSEIVGYSAGRPAANRFDEEKPPTPAASRYEPEPEQ